MSSAPTATTPLTGTAPTPRPADSRHARLKLKPDGTATGLVDGGWWPRSRNLEQELPALVEALGEHLGHVEAVSYHLGDWDTPPRRTSIAGTSVRLGGYRLQRGGSVDVIARNRRLTLLVIDPEHDQDVAEQALTASVGPFGADDFEALLAHVPSGATSPNEDRP